MATGMGEETQQRDHVHRQQQKRKDMEDLTTYIAKGGEQKATMVQSKDSPTASQCIPKKRGESRQPQTDAAASCKAQQDRACRAEDTEECAARSESNADRSNP